MLEYALIQQHKPRFNVRLKDDKSYPWLAVTVSEEWPRPAVVAGQQAQGGPLLRALRPRRRHPRHARPAAAELPGPDLLRQQVPTPPAAGPALPALPHRAVLGPVRRRGRPRALPGDGGGADALPLGRHRRRWWPAWRPRWSEAADALEFERAARLRDRLAAVRKAAETQQMVSERPEDLDVHRASPRTSWRRPSRSSTSAGAGWSGRSGFVADKVEDLTRAQFVERVLEQLYGAPEGLPGHEVPRQVLVPHRPERGRGGGRMAGRPARAVRWPSASPSVVTSGRCRRWSPATPGRTSSRHRLRRAADHNSRSKALTELQEAWTCPRHRCGSSATT